MNYFHIIIFKKYTKAVQKCECTQCHRTVHFKMVNMLCLFYHKKRAYWSTVQKFKSKGKYPCFPTSDLISIFKQLIVMQHILSIFCGKLLREWWFFIKIKQIYKTFKNSNQNTSCQTVTRILFHNTEIQLHKCRYTKVTFTFLF